jgi:hypothetical protein
MKPSIFCIYNGFSSNIIIILFLIFGFLSVSNAVPPTPPGNIMEGKEILEGRLRDGRVYYPIIARLDPQVIESEIEAGISFQESKIYNMKKEVFFRERLDSNKPAEIKRNISIKIDKPGHYELEIRIRGKINDQEGFSNKMVRHILLEKGGRYRILSGKQFVREIRRKRENTFKENLKKDPENPKIRLLHEETMTVPDEIASNIKPQQVKTELQIRPEGPSEYIKKFIEERATESWSPKDPITVLGRLVFLDHDGVWRPLVNVSVNLYDEDTGFDDHLGVTATDWNGYWSFSVNNNDGWFADGRDIYYTFKLENTRIRVQDCDGIDSTYSWASAVHDDLSDGTVLNFGTQTGVQNPKTMQIWNMLNLAWNHAVTAGGRDPGFVDTCYPEDGGTHWDRFWEEIDIGEEYNDGPDVVTHEYAHAVMWYAYGDDNPSPGGSHSFGDTNQNKSLSWSEGWATGFMLSARPDGFYNWHEGDSGRNIENFSSSNRDGNRQEGRVAAAINDMLDYPNDDNNGILNRGRDSYGDNNSSNRVQLSKMLNDTLWGSYHDDFEDFWYSLSGELTSNQRTLAHEIMYYNWMNVSEPGSCVASKAVVVESREPEQVLQGLRKFRDLALKDFSGGRGLINMYYRNSPELALILLRDKELRQNVIRIINHFSQLGYTFASNNRLKKLSDSGAAVVDANMVELIQSVIRQVEKKGSLELRNDLLHVKRAVQSVQGLDIRTLQEKLADTKMKQQQNHKKRLKQSILNPNSNKALRSEEVNSLIKRDDKTNKKQLK